MKIKFNKLVSYYKPYKKIFFLDLLFSFLSAILVLAMPFIIRYLTDTLIYTSLDESANILLQSAVLIVVLLGLKFGCDYFTLYYGHSIGAKMEADMRYEIFQHYQKMSLDFFNEREIGDLISRVTSDLANVSELLHHLPEELFKIITIIGGAIIVFFALNMQEAIVFLAIITIIVVFLYFFFKKTHKAFTKNHEKLSKINSQIEDSLAGIQVTKAFSREDIELKKFKFNNMKLIESQKNVFRYVGFFNSGLELLLMSILPIITIYGLILLYNNQISVSTLLTFLLCESTIIPPIFSLIEQADLFQNTMAGFRRFCEILDITPKISDSSNALDLKDIQGNIRFENVSFNYEHSNPIFEGLNMEIKAGEYIALVGPSGSGKSTLCNLIARFYDVQSGKIYLDNIDLKHIKLKTLRENIGFVQQDVFLFSDSIIENIRYAKPSATDKEVFDAAKKANAHNFIISLPQKYNTKVGRNGVKLSGGQKQRIAIARVFLKNPPILIFDEATSNLDSENENYIQKSMWDLSKNRTTIVIAHRLSTIRNAKRILVMKDGKIVEEGTHKKLLDKHGTYAEFYNLL